MQKAKIIVEVKLDRWGGIGWEFKFVAGNGQVMMVSEREYEHRYQAVRAAERLFDAMSDCLLVYPEK